MSKKLILIAAGAGLLSFAGSFVFAWLFISSPAAPPADSDSQSAGVAAAEKAEPGLPPFPSETTKTPDGMAVAVSKALTEQQLKALIQDVKTKMNEYDNKLRILGVREQRLQIAHNMLKEDVDNLNNMRTELASIIANLKSERDKLIKSKLEIEQTEKTNLISIAATYDKMEPASAGKIMSNMCSMRSTTQSGTGGSFDDAVKILYYMSERTEAKLLAEIAVSEPALAAALCQRLKQISEVN